MQPFVDLLKIKIYILQLQGYIAQILTGSISSATSRAGSLASHKRPSLPSDSLSTASKAPPAPVGDIGGLDIINYGEAEKPQGEKRELIVRPPQAMSDPEDGESLKSVEEGDRSPLKSQVWSQDQS